MYRKTITGSHGPSWQPPPPSDLLQILLQFVFLSWHRQRSSTLAAGFQNLGVKFFLTKMSEKVIKWVGTQDAVTILENNMPLSYEVKHIYLTNQQLQSKVNTQEEWKHVYKKSCTHMFLEASFVIAKNGNNTNVHQLANGWTNCDRAIPSSKKEENINTHTHR